MNLTSDDVSILCFRQRTGHIMSEDSRWCIRLTFLLMASFSNVTTSFPTTPGHWKPLVQLIRVLCGVKLSVNTQW